jgi:hypothetical protein
MQISSKKLLNPANQVDHGIFKKVAFLGAISKKVGSLS